MRHQVVQHESWRAATWSKNANMLVMTMPDA
jgi:hypothetical protein